MTITIDWHIADIIQKKSVLDGFKSPEDLVFQALKVYIEKKIDDDIESGLQDIKNGRCTEITSNNIGSIAKSIITKSRLCHQK